MTQTRDIETATVVVTLHSGHQVRLFGVAWSDARADRARFSDWASLGGSDAPRSAFRGSRALDLISETTEEAMVTPFTSIAALSVVPEVKE